MNYLQIPTEVSSHDIRAKEFSWSPGMYRRVEIPNSNTRTVRELLDPNRPYDKGTEPGSLYYMARSEWGFIRTKALQEHSTLLYPKGESIVALNPRGIKDWKNFDLRDGDLLMTKDSNVGECVMVDGDGWANHAWSNGIVRLHPRENHFYFFAFVKHPLFKAQLLSMLPKGVTITHARDLWLDCTIPFPNQSDAPRVVAYVSALMQAMMEKEKAIRSRSELILKTIETELDAHQTKPFVFDHPTIHEIRRVGRLDAALYSKQYKQVLHSVEKYKHGSTNPKADGFEVVPGPSLEIKLLRVRVDCNEARPGFYALILPTNISDNGTLIRTQYLGTPKNLPLLQNGDIVFGESGCHRSLVLIDVKENCTTNAHGIYARRSDGNLTKSIFLRCFYDWLDKTGIINLLAVGGNGGHFSPEYFSSLPVPKFPDEIQADIARLYHNPTLAPTTMPTLDDFVEWHRDWNENLGIWELDREMKALQTTLRQVQDQIIRGEMVVVPFA